MKLSILMPVFNEAETVATVLKRVLDVQYPCEVELVIVDDGSADSTPQILAELADPRVSVHTHPVNRGKGAAVRTAADRATGTHVVMCDADLEYSPEDLPALLEKCGARRIDGTGSIEQIHERIMSAEGQPH